MSFNIANQLPGCRLVIATVAAVVLSASLSQSAFADSNVGIWKVDPSKSNYNSSSATLAIRKTEGGSAATGSFIVISGTGVYRMTSAAAATESVGLKPVDFAAMTRTGEAVLIGTHPRSNDLCLFACQHGLSETVRTVTFKIVNKGEQQIRDMLAAE